MNILQLVSHYVPAYHFGGVLHVAHSLSKALNKQGHSVHVCTTHLKDPTHDLDVPLDKAVNVDGAQVYYEPVKLSRYWGFSPVMIRRIWAEAEWADVILVHFHYQFISLIGSAIARRRHKPYIIFTHGSLNQFGVAARSTSRKQAYINLLEKRNFKNALFVAYHSQEEMESSFGFGRQQVVPNGIDPAAFVPCPTPGQFREKYPVLQDRLIYLYLGRIDAGKGLDLLLPAFRKLSIRDERVHLVIAGGDERGYEGVVRRTIQELGIADRVTLTGLISGVDKLTALQDSDVYVLPSRSEGLSIAMLEAMYMGLPVVITNRMGLWRQIEQHRCGLVVSLDEQQLSQSLYAMAANEDRGSMGKRGHELVRANYTWDVIAQNLANRIQRG